MMGRHSFSGNVNVGTLLAPLGPVPKTLPKAVLTIQPPSNKILMANETAVSLLGISANDLVGATLGSLCRTPDSTTRGLRVGELSGAFLEMSSSSLTTHEGDLVPVYGRLVDVKGGSTANTTVSLWLYPLRAGNSAAPPVPNSGSHFSESLPESALRQAGFPNPVPDPAHGRYLVVMEPVTRLTTSLTLGPKGRVFRADAICGRVFGTHCESLLLGKDVEEIVPALDKDTLTNARKPTTFACTGLRCDSGARFPLSVTLKPDVDEDGEVIKFDLEVEALETISGVLSLTADGSVRSFNTHFSEVLADRAQSGLLHKHVNELIPDFVLNPAPVSIPPSAPLSAVSTAGPACSDVASTSQSADVAELANRVRSLALQSQAPNLPPSSGKRDENANRVPVKPQEGAYHGHIVHKDGSRIPVTYHIRRMQASEGKRPHYCVWLLWQLEAQPEPPSPTSPTARAPKLSSHALDMWVGEDHLGSTCDAIIGAGQYADTYRTLSQIGKGAFGAVKLAVRRDDELLVVTKFICKSKVLSSSWTESAKGGKIPIELDLLSKLKHPNIVNVMDTFSNDDYYQVVMERHGSGMDLFEFIDREPKLDEPLVSYIFRQLVSAVAYLDELKIVHRDVKDENVIIDENFHVKLIDFGSAAYYGREGQDPFALFCGTIEYASPEILLGNRYRGPEAEIWSMGVLLFTLEFGEAPFQSPEETIEASWVAPWDVSEGLAHLLSGLLHPEPTLRFTIKQAERHWWLLQPVDSTRYRLKDVLSDAGQEECHPAKYYLTDNRVETPVTAKSGPAAPFRTPALGSEETGSGSE